MCRGTSCLLPTSLARKQLLELALGVQVAVVLAHHLRPVLAARAHNVEQRRIGVVEPARVEVSQQGDHADEAGDGENIDRGRRLLANVNLALRNVIAQRQGLRAGGGGTPGQQKRGRTSSRVVDLAAA